MKFVHFADCHIDGFREEKLSQLGFNNLEFVITFAIENSVDFVLIAGDLFNNALPRVDALKSTVKELHRLQEKNIPVYVIPGSHDFSTQGKTMLDVLELAGLLINVMKGHFDENGDFQLEYTIDKKTNTYITGIGGKKGMLDVALYDTLKLAKVPTDTKKIFMFHTTLEELKTPELNNMPGSSISMLPLGFSYYAGGHVHIRKRYDKDDYKNVVYPGPTFPNSFSELEQLKQGSFVFYDDTKEPSYKHILIKSKDVCSIEYDATNQTPSQITENIKEELEKTDCKDKILLLRIGGVLSSGKPQEVNYKEIFQEAQDKGAYIVLKNTYKLTSTILTSEESTEQESVVEIEKEAIQEFVGKINLPKGLNENECITELIQSLAIEPLDGERKTAFSDRIVQITKDILEKN